MQIRDLIELKALQGAKKYILKNKAKKDVQVMSNSMLLFKFNSGIFPDQQEQRRYRDEH